MMRHAPNHRHSDEESVQVGPYERRYRGEVRDLLYGSYRSHSHLDWHDTDHWLDRQAAPIRLAWVGGRVVGLMATSEPLNATCWLRLAAVADEMPPQPILTALWGDLLPTLHEQAIHTVALLVLRDWIVRYLEELGFHYAEDIVTLRRGAQPPARVPVDDLQLRFTHASDMPRIAEIDEAAFAPPWQLTEVELFQAQRVAALSTVAQRDHTVIGYQLTTLHLESAHLARLAVEPESQGQGVGGVLLADLIERLTRRGIRSITVNTQASNTRSQRLYTRFGFQRNGYDLPVWMIEL